MFLVAESPRRINYVVLYSIKFSKTLKPYSQIKKMTLNFESDILKLFILAERDIAPITSTVYCKYM